LGLEPFSALGHLKLNRLVFLERLKPFPLDGGMMHKDIRTVLLGNETITLGIIKPLYRTLYSHAESILLKIATLPVAAQPQTAARKKERCVPPVPIRIQGLALTSS
jgi:hypothetical protein